MIEIICRDGRFLAKGSFALGLSGVHVNADFDGDSISIRDTLEDLLADLRREKPYFWGEFSAMLRPGEEDGDVIARAMTRYYNQKEEAIRKNQKQINDNIWIKLFMNLYATEFAFWELEECLIPEKAAGYDDGAFDALYEAAGPEIMGMNKAFRGTPNDGSLEKPDVEGALRRLFPVFDFDALMASIEPEGVGLEGEYISFQFSDGYEGTFFECAYDKLDGTFTFCDWHNH